MPKRSREEIGQVKFPDATPPTVCLKLIEKNGKEEKCKGKKFSKNGKKYVPTKKDWTVYQIFECTRCYKNTHVRLRESKIDKNDEEDELKSKRQRVDIQVPLHDIEMVEETRSSVNEMTSFITPPSIATTITTTTTMTSTTALEEEILQLWIGKPEKEHMEEIITPFVPIGPTITTIPINATSSITTTNAPASHHLQSTPTSVSGAITITTVEYEFLLEQSRLLQQTMNSISTNTLTTMEIFIEYKKNSTTW